MIKVTNTNYAGEVLEMLLTRAATSNELVEKGLIHMEPGVEKAYFLPRMKTGKMLQKRKEMPTSQDSKGDFTYDERALIPVDFMAYRSSIPVPLKISGVNGNRKGISCFRSFRQRDKTRCCVKCPNR